VLSQRCAWRKKIHAQLAVLRVCGQEPLQFYWFRDAAKFSNSLLSGISGLLPAVVKKPLVHDGDSLPYTDSFEYQRLNLSTAAEAALKPCVAGTYRVKAFANDHNLSNRLHASIWLLKVNDFPTGMYASQIWAALYARQGREEMMDNPR